ncbi:putative transposase [Acinetobacter baumannii 1146103]|nr:putative transposase [Acinetobacter baumannii 1656-2]KCX59486.1 putative transposase [Acinetobacter baumannii 1146103]
MQLHQQKGMISLSPPTICNSAASCADAPSPSAASSARHSRASASRPIPASKAARTKRSRCNAVSSNKP